MNRRAVLLVAGIYALQSGDRSAAVAVVDCCAGPSVGGREKGDGAGGVPEKDVPKKIVGLGFVSLSQPPPHSP